jgi:hypothetical protein
MAAKYHPSPLSGGDRKALSKELVKSRAMTGILAERSQEKRRGGEALIWEADNLACQSWNEKMWSDGGPAQPSPTIGQAINGGFPWLEVKCSWCRTRAALTWPRSAVGQIRRCICWKDALTAGSARRRSGRVVASWSNWRRGAAMTLPRQVECAISTASLRESIRIDIK